MSSQKEKIKTLRITDLVLTPDLREYHKTFCPTIKKLRMT